jgi:hypothetical protein
MAGRGMRVAEGTKQRFTDVEIPVGIGRPVVKGELGPRVGLEQLVVDLLVVPKLLDLRLAHNRVRTLVELGLGEVDCLAVSTTDLIGVLFLALGLLFGFLETDHQHRMWQEK